MKKLTLVTENVGVVTSTVSNAHLILDQVAMLLPTGIKLGRFSNPTFSLIETTWSSMGTVKLECHLVRNILKTFLSDKFYEEDYRGCSSFSPGAAPSGCENLVVTGAQAWFHTCFMIGSRFILRGSHWTK